MKLIGKLIKTSTLEGKNWRQELQRFLLNYRSTPHVTTKIPPCELLFNRRVHGTLPELSTQRVINKHSQAKVNIEEKKKSNKRYYDVKNRTKSSGIKIGDTVICKQNRKNKNKNSLRGLILNNLQLIREKAIQSQQVMNDSQSLETYHTLK